MKKVLSFFALLIVVNLLSASHADAAEVIKIYPADDAQAQLYDDDGISNWSQARNYQGLVFREPFTSGITNNIGNINVRSDKAHAGYYRIYRVSKTFDLSSLPENAVIRTASLHLFKTTANTHGNIDVVITSHQREDNSHLQKQDWNINNFGDVPFAEQPLVDGYNVFQLNTEGLSYLNERNSAVVTLGFLTDYDFYDVEPPVQVLAAGWHEVEKEGAEFDPYLEITYTVPEENNFPLYTQIESGFTSLEETREWADDSLAGGAAGKGCETIAKCGCTITSLVMLGRAHGITTSIDGSDVNPGNLNRWLTENGGYTTHGLLRFDQAVKYFGKVENGVEKTYLKWTPGFLSGNEVKERVGDGVPTVSSMVARNRNGYEIPTHFVLVTEILEDGSYGVNDPLWYNTKNLDDDAARESYVQDYNNRITNGRNLTFVESPVAVAGALSMSVVGRPSAVPTSFIRTTTLLANGDEAGTAPVEMYLVTPSGERLGANPRTGEVYELQNGHYWRETFLTDPFAEEYVAPTDVVKSLAANELEAGVYKLYVVGTGIGSYELSGFVHDIHGKGSEFGFVRETVAGLLTVYELNIETGEAATLPVDAASLKETLDGVVIDRVQNKFFTMWIEKIFAEIKVGKNEQAIQHVSTFKTLMKAKKVESRALILMLDRLEQEIR